MSSFIDKYKKIPITVKASVCYTICSIIQKSISFLTVPLFTKMLTTEEYGQFSIYQSWLNIIMIFVTLSLHGGVFNNAMMKYEKDRNGFIASMQGLVFCLCGVWFIIYYLGRNFWNSILELPTILVIVMFIQMAFQPSMSFWSGKQRYEYKYKNFVIVTLLLAIINPIVGILAVLTFNQKGYARILSDSGVIIAISFILCLYNFIKGKKFFNKEYWKYALTFNIPLIPYYISQMLFTQSDRIMIGKMVSDGKAGIYSLAVNCSMVLSFVLTAIESSFIPWLYNNIKNKEYKSIKKIGNQLLMLVGVALLGMTLIGPELVWLMAPPEYQEAIWVIPPVVGGLLFLFEAKLFVGIEFYYENKRGLVHASILSAVVNIGLNYLLIPRFGFVVAGYTTLIAYILFAFMNYIYMQKSILNGNEYKEKVYIYDYKFILRFSVIYMLLSLLITILYPYPVVRITILLLTLFLVCVNYKKILRQVQQIRGKSNESD